MLSYIKGTKKFGTFFPASAKVTMNLVGCYHSNWGDGFDDSICTSRYLLCFAKSWFSWSRRKQENTSQSIAEYEYINVTYFMNQAICLVMMLMDLSHEQAEATKITCDDKSAVSISKMFHGRA